MHIIIAILFGIGLLLTRDPSKLPWFLQIIRAGLIKALRWIFKLSIIGGVIGLCVYFYKEYDNKIKSEEAAENIIREQIVQDSLAKIEEARIKAETIPEYGTDEYWQWRLDNPVKAKELDDAQKAEKEAAEKADKENYSTILGSWSRADKELSETKNIGVFTFKANKTFFTNFSEKGTYKLNPEDNKLYIYYDSGKAESFNMKVYNENEISGKLLQEEYTETFFIKRPRTEKEPSSEGAKTTDEL